LGHCGSLYMSLWDLEYFRATNVEKMLGLKQGRRHTLLPESPISLERLEALRSGAVAQWPRFWDKKTGPNQAPLNKPLIILGHPKCNPKCHLLSAWCTTCGNRSPIRSQMILELGQNGFNAQHVSHPTGWASAFPHIAAYSLCRFDVQPSALSAFFIVFLFFNQCEWHVSTDASKPKLCSSDSELFLVQDALSRATWWSDEVLLFWPWPESLQMASPCGHPKSQSQRVVPSIFGQLGTQHICHQLGPIALGQCPRSRCGKGKSTFGSFSSLWWYPWHSKLQHSRSYIHTTLRKHRKQ